MKQLKKLKRSPWERLNHLSAIQVCIWNEAHLSSARFYHKMSDGASSRQIKLVFNDILGQSAEARKFSISINLKHVLESFHGWEDKQYRKAFQNDVEKRTWNVKGNKILEVGDSIFFQTFIGFLRRIADLKVFNLTSKTLLLGRNAFSFSLRSCPHSCIFVQKRFRRDKICSKYVKRSFAFPYMSVSWHI